jgi:3-oxoacyl-[acyl-carrier-protein] synthase III
MHSRIAGTGSYLPERIVTNDALAEVRGDVLSKIAREIASMPVAPEPPVALPNAS